MIRSQNQKMLPLWRSLHSSEHAIFFINCKTLNLIVFLVSFSIFCIKNHVNWRVYLKKKILHGAVLHKWAYVRAGKAITQQSCLQLYYLSSPLIMWMQYFLCAEFLRISIGLSPVSWRRHESYFSRVLTTSSSDAPPPKARCPDARRIDADPDPDPRGVRGDSRHDLIDGE